MNISPRRMLLLALLGGLMSLVAADTSQAQSFTVRVPQRTELATTTNQIARLKITLTTAGPAPGAETLSIFGGSRPLADGPEFIDSQQVWFYAPNANTRVIEIYFDKFIQMGGASYCSLTSASYNDGSGSISVPMTLTLTPGVTVTEYRLSSYTALSDLNCGCPGRRVSAPGATWLTTPPGADKGRHAYDVVLVLDRSGSMSDPIPSGIPGSDSAIKMNALKTAVGEFIDTWTLEMNAPPDDRLAVVWFESTVTTEAGGAFTTRQAGWNTLKNAVNSAMTGNMTAMGDGVSKAVDMLEDDNVGNDRHIVLLTNGMQNEGNLILPNASGPPPHTFFRLNTNAYAPLASRCIPVEAIGFGGVPGDLPIDLLAAIAAETGGSAQQPVNSIAAADAFGNSLVNILKGNTLSVLTRTTGTLNSGSAQAPPVPFNLDSSVQQAIVVLDWTGAANGLTLDLLAPGGVNPVFSQQVVTPNYVIKTVELPTNGPAGQWQARISRNAGTADLPYHLSIYTMEGRFSSQFAFKKADFGTGDDIVLTATLGFGGQPLLGQGNGLAVRVARPENGLNNLLHNLQVSSTVLTTQPAGVSPDAYTRPYERKVFELLKQPAFGQGVALKTDPVTYHLLDNGNPANGDDKAGDGVYSMRYPQTRTPGEYQFDVTMNLTTPTGAVNRFEERDTQVNVLRIDPGESEVNATNLGGGNFLVVIVPADRFGNFLGPGFEDQIKVAVVTGGGTVSGPVVDERQNGTYTAKLTGVTSATGTLVRVSFRDQPFAETNLNPTPRKRFAIFGGLGGNFPHGDFDTNFDSGVSAHGGFEFMFTNRFSTEFSAGYERFNFTAGSGHVNLGRASGNLKFYPVIGTFQFGLFGGGGVYFNSGDAHGGLNFGAVGEYRINTTVGVESAYNFHTVFTNGQNTNYSTLTGGLRFRF